MSFFPPCKHFGLCGGCDYQDIDYKEQLKAKEERLKEIFSHLRVKEMAAMVPSPEIFHYRNKMEYAVSGEGQDILIGLRQKKRFYRIVDLEECRIFSDTVAEVFAKFKYWIKKNNIEPYQLRRHSGNIRYVAMRHSKYYNEMMIIAVLAKEEGSIDSLALDLKNIKIIKSFYTCVNDGLADVSVTDRLKLIFGESHIKEKINEIEYLISANSFFQTNPYCCGRLYGIIRDETKGFGGQALDMCCGAGGITLQIADNFDKVIGVDNHEQNIKDALLNAGINKKDNVEFVLDDAQNFLLNSAGEKGMEKFSTLILDPPRAGLSKKIKESICEKGAENVVYVSCNPANLALDLKILTGAYTIEKIIPVDMFPHTRHAEIVAILKRNKV